MDIKSEIEIKDEPVEGLVDDGNNSQSFKQDSCFEGVQKEIIYSVIHIKDEVKIEDESMSFEVDYSDPEQVSHLQENCKDVIDSLVDIKDEIEFKDEPLSFEEEYSHTDQKNEQISQLEKSQSQNSNEDHVEKDVRLKIKSPSRRKKQFIKNSEKDELELDSMSQAMKEEAEGTSPQANLIMGQNYFSSSRNSDMEGAATSRGPASALCNENIKSGSMNAFVKEISVLDSKNSSNKNNKTVMGSCCVKKCKKPFKCSSYEESLSNKISLKTHIQAHKGFNCSYCEKSFTLKSTLETHIQTQVDDKTFKCSYCEKSFNRKDNLDRHIRTHTGEKPFKCSDCEKSFNRKDHLERHIRNHASEKPFKCTYCEKSFNQKGNLKSHIRTHTGEKPFKCTYCEKSFKVKCTLGRHVLTHTDENSVFLL